MIPSLSNHLWQSTLFAAVAGLLTIALRKNRAQARYWLWLSASLKFLIPFSLLLDLGNHLGSHLQWTPAAQKMAATPAIALTTEQIAEPFPETALVTSTPARSDWTPFAILGIWTCGFAAIALIRFRGWLRIRAAVRASVPIEIPASVPASVRIRSAPGLLEPGVVGWLRPILLLPAGIAERLTPPQLDAVLAHELCHVNRRDNLFASIHMLVEAMFWFHPLVWWIGARLVEERERACDEEVLILGSEPRVYAEAIVTVCKAYAESPLVCVSGVTGSNIKKRIEAIMSNRIVVGLNFATKAALTVAGIAAVAAPIAIGILNAPTAQAQSRVQSSAARPSFEVASIRTCKPGDSVTTGRGGSGRGGGAGEISGASPGRLHVRCETVANLIRWAYLLFPDDLSPNDKPWPNLGSGPKIPPVSSRLLDEPLQGSPAWVNSEKFTIEAETDDPVANGPLAEHGAERGIQGGTPAARIMEGPMLRTLLEDRFNLKIHHQTKEVPVYELTVAKGGPKLRPSQPGSCIPWSPRDPDHPLPPPTPGQLASVSAMACGLFIGSGNGIDVNGIAVARLCWELSRVVVGILDRDCVDKTGIAGVYDFHFDIPQEPTPAEVAPGSQPRDPADLLAAIQASLQKAGLKLEAAKGTGDFLVIDHIERPSEN
jgi:bla regulator protein BlaR1